MSDPTAINAHRPFWYQSGPAPLNVSVPYDVPGPSVEPIAKLDPQGSNDVPRGSFHETIGSLNELTETDMGMARYSFAEVRRSAFWDHGIGCEARPNEITFKAGERVAWMLRSESKGFWTGMYWEGSELGSVGHRVSGRRGAVAEWLVRALVDGPNPTDAEAMRLSYQSTVRRFHRGASA